jgi:hypothetical protein
VPRKVVQAACDKAGIRIPSIALRNKLARGVLDLSPLATGQIAYSVPAPIVDERTDKEIETEIENRFKALDRMAFGVVAGKFRSLIASGNPGIGKTYTLEYILEGAANDGKIQFTAIRGYVKPTGLYRLLYECRHENCVLLLDDADSIWQDEIGLNLLKGALDTTHRRTISWRSEKVFTADDGEQLPNSFDFKGAVVFITNLNFDFETQRANRLTPHLQALISRSFYLDLNLATPRELMVRIKSVINNSEILDAVPEKGRKLIMKYMEDSQDKLRELSLRMVLKLAAIQAGAKSEDDFYAMANATCTRQRKG